jgi:hypothetical protein
MVRRIDDAFEHGHAVSTSYFFYLLIRTRRPGSALPLRVAAGCNP